MTVEVPKLQAVFGLALILTGFLFDFAFVTTTKNFTKSLKKTSESQAWKTYAYGLVKSYLFVLGFLSIALALMYSQFGIPEKTGQTILWLMASGSVLLIAGGIWEAHNGPAYKMEPPCYVLIAGLLAVFLSITLEIRELISGKGA